MRGIPSLITDIRKNVFTEVARMAYEGGDYTKAEDLPYIIVPGDKALHRESIFLERAIAGERVRLAMGLSIRPIQSRTLMTEGMDQAAIAESYYEPPLINIIPYACHACPTKQYKVTQFCQNCLAASCQKVCPKGAISFVNGKSQGRREKNDSTVIDRYRLRWNDVVYEPGEITVVAYDANGNKAAEKTVRTAGKAAALKITPNRSSIAADGDELVYFTVEAVDRNGNPVPDADNLVKFTVTGAGTYEAGANGDATCLLPFQNPEMKLFSGAATAIARSAKTPGTLTIKATAKGLKPATATVEVHE